MPAIVFLINMIAIPRIARYLSSLGLALALALGFATANAEAATVSVHLNARHKVIKVAPGVKMQAWTFNGTVPGPVIRATQGDTVELTLKNSDHHMAHSVDFHAAEVSPQANFSDVLPGETKTFSFVAQRPGVFMYHCGTSPVLEHIGMGMYGAIIIDPIGGRPPANETVLVQSEFYGKYKKGGKKLKSSYKAIQTQDPKLAAFNGKAFRYRDKPIPVAVGQPQRIYVVAAGPTLGSDFHVVGEVFDTVQPDGNPANDLFGVSTYGVPSGGGALFELTFNVAGSYPFVNHAFRWADAGALGLFKAS